MQTLIGLDQATKLSGVSVWHDDRLSDSYVLDTNIKENKPLLRMSKFRNQFEKVIKKEKPDLICLESVQFQHNFNTYLQLAQLQGVIFGLLFEYGIPFFIVSASEWRSYLGIKGRNRLEYKQNTIDYIYEHFNLQCTDDAADSIAIGLWGIGNIVYKENRYEKIKQNTN